jgi:4'-phosphopantetheinyl transferase
MTGRPITVLAWPAIAALRTLQRAETVFVIRIETASTNDRTMARRQIRTALGEALGVLIGHDASRFNLDTVPGQPLQLVGSPIGVSLSHEAGLSVAAIHLRGTVGIDIVRRDAIAQAEADWPMLARDYLGPAASQRIGQADPAQRLQVFATEWTAQEARLKCHGLGLVEWDAARESIAEFELHPLVLPLQWLGTLAVEMPHR